MEQIIQALNTKGVSDSLVKEIGAYNNELKQLDVRFQAISLVPLIEVERALLVSRRCLLKKIEAEVNHKLEKAKAEYEASKQKAIDTFIDNGLNEDTAEKAYADTTSRKTPETLKHLNDLTAQMGDIRQQLGEVAQQINTPSYSKIGLIYRRLCGVSM